MKQRLFASAAVIAVIVVIAFAYARRSAGQQSAPAVQRSTVNVVRVKPDMVDAWIDFQSKRTIPALKKAGVQERTVYQSAYGPSFEFRVVTPLAKFADRDNPSPIERALGSAGAKEYNDAYRKLIASSQTFVIQSLPEASYDPNPNADYNLIVLAMVHATPGRGSDLVNFLKTDFLPVQKTGQVKRFLVNQVIFGGDANEYRAATFMDKFADLDAGPATVRVLGPEGAAKLLQKATGMVASVQIGVYTRNQALSFRTRPSS